MKKNKYGWETLKIIDKIRELLSPNKTKNTKKNKEMNRPCQRHSHGRHTEGTILKKNHRKLMFKFKKKKEETITTKIEYHKINKAWGKLKDYGEKHPWHLDVAE